MSERDKLAFPSPQCGDWSPEYGMTLREHYAGLAMQALISAHDKDGIWTAAHDPEGVAKIAVSNADALIAELERTA